jgi:hypothetical protein
VSESNFSSRRAVLASVIGVAADVAPHRALSLVQLEESSLTPLAWEQAFALACNYYVGGFFASFVLQD